MRSTSRVSGFLLALVGAIALAACDDGPTRPSGGNNPPPPPAPLLVRLAINGPDTVAPGVSAQFTLTGQYSDGSSRNLTSDPSVVWRTSSTRVLTVASGGVATGVDSGEASVFVSFNNRTAVKSGVIVVPPGTYRLMGTITDTGVPISGARVEVTHGPATGMVATANPTYRLYGVSGDTEIRVQRDGYREERRRIQVASHETADFELTPLVPRENFEGTYTLTVTASDDCGMALPEQARVRAYTAALTQQGPRVTVRLEGTNFYTDGARVYNSFSGMLQGDRMAFTLMEPYYYFYYLPDVMDLFSSSPTSYWYIAGTVTTSRSGNRHSGFLSGPIVTIQGPPRFTTLARCDSSRHGFELVRR